MPDVAGVARSVLIVEDDPVFRRRLSRAFRDRGFEVAEAGNAVEAAESARREPPEYALVDLRLPDGFGLEVVRRLMDLESGTVIVVLTGYGSIATALEAVRLGAVHYLTKPADVDEILAGFARGDGGQDGATAQPANSAPSLARVEWEHIQRVLSDCAGNVSQAARVLGIHRRSLQRKLGKAPTLR